MEKQMKRNNKAIVQPDIMHIKAWQSLKAKYSNTIVLLRIEECYFTFDNDAYIVSSITGIILSECEHVEMQCCFPVAELDICLNKLVKAGNRVAICDQLVSPP
ncbi:hypothetical protein [Panacibacter ginsenosidivorans]|nr:hypothetical protein [Panacibacter ginsenosidivorans]